MKCFLSIVGLAALAAASLVSEHQTPISALSLHLNADDTSKNDTGLGKEFCESKAYNVTMGIVDPKGGEALPIIHREGKLWVVEVGRAPTVWTLIPARTEGRYYAYSQQPNGDKHWWNEAYYEDQAITVNNEYGRKALTLAAAEPIGSAFTRTTIYWDQRCLVSNGVNQVLKMAQWSNCDQVAITAAKALEWHTTAELCKEQKKEAEEIYGDGGVDALDYYPGEDKPCNNYGDCTRWGCLIGYRCCRGTAQKPSTCTCADIGLGTGFWYRACH